MSLKHLALLLAVGTLSGSVAMAEEMLSNKRLDLAKQLLANSDFPGQIIRAIGPQLSLDIAERYKKLGKPTEEKVVSDFLVEFGKAMKGRLDTALSAATPAVARVFTELFRDGDEPDRADAAARGARRHQGNLRRPEAARDRAAAIGKRVPSWPPTTMTSSSSAPARVA